MIRLELITVNLLQLVHQHGGPSRPRQNCHSCIFKTIENSNLRICIQYFGHHSKTACRKSAKSMRYRVRPKFEFYRKSLLNSLIPKEISVAWSSNYDLKLNCPQQVGSRRCRSLHFAKNRKVGDFCKVDEFSAAVSLVYKICENCKKSQGRRFLVRMG